MFDPVDPRQTFPDLERGILQYWKEEAMFHRSLHNRRAGEVFSFYDGPPFATGLPHYGHLLAGTIKDVIPRYQTMRGKYVERRFGWDCHGLPIENLIEKENDLKTKRDIEKLGISSFNELCRGSVQRYAKEWRQVVERMGRWVDLDWDYKTMDAPFMESIWWVFKQLWDKKLIYEGHKPMHICPRCVTPLSNFEVTQGYKEVTDVSVTAKFRLADEKNTFLLAWTTMPWTLPGNLFLAVHPKTKYVTVRPSTGAEEYIVAKDLVEKVFAGKEYEVVGKPFPGKELIGKTYEPLFPYFVKEYPGAFRVVGGDFVTTEDGTGIVHIAPGFGEDDFNVWLQETKNQKRKTASLLQHVTMEGRFVPAVSDFADQEVKPKDDAMKTDRKIADWLEKHGKLFAKESYKHTYPHCWRCDSPLLNYATSSWFVAVEKIKDDILDVNAKTEWVPAHLRDGRFGKWLEGARDWAISRNRYWGTPLPIWRVQGTGDRGQKTDAEVISSRDELMSKCLIRFTKITAVRHGESEANVKPRYQGKVPGTDLTERGREQAKRTAELLAGSSPFPVAIIYSSPLARARQTAEILAEQTGAQIVIDERLREVDFGEYEGKTIDFSDLAILKARRALKLASNTPESVYHFEGMETWAQVQKRLQSFFDDILPRHLGEHVVVVTHADPIQNIRHLLTKEDPIKLSHQPYPTYAEPFTFFWDHDRGVELDLHKHIVDDLIWPGSASKESVDVTIVRHGQTDWNLAGTCQGQADRKLTDVGRQQAHDQGKKLKGKRFDIIITSDLVRCVETAEIIAKELDMSVAEKWPLLRERYFGSWQGQQIEALLRKYPCSIEQKQLAFHTAAAPDGETLSRYLARGRAICEELVRRFPGKRVLLVAHGGIVQSLRTFTENLSFAQGRDTAPENAEAVGIQVHPFLRRVPEVLDCWFESGSMPYAQGHHPFSTHKVLSRHCTVDVLDGPVRKVRVHKGHDHPPGFPADFIAEGVDQTRGWFYTLTVLAAALYKEPAFIHCVVNGTVLAEDGRKMSKRLKNYPDPLEVVERHGADALRFTLMRSPAVRGEDMRFSEKLVEETMRSVILPLWNAYGFFVTYANAAGYQGDADRQRSSHPLDRYILTEVQDLVNRVTEEIDGYDLSATCGQFLETIDALTNWYIRLSRRRFAGKTAAEDGETASEQDQQDALDTLYEVLVTMSQLLAPFCPYVTDAIYLNLASDPHGSVHLTDWPQPRPLQTSENAVLKRHRMLRTIVTLGLKLRADKKVKVRCPLAKATVALPPALALDDESVALLAQELNVKRVEVTDDPGSIGERVLLIDARKVGPRIGAKVQGLIAAGKNGEFEEREGGGFLVHGEIIEADEAQLLYRGNEGQDIASEQGIVIALDMRVTDDLALEGEARDLIRAIQKLRKDNGYAFGEKVAMGIEAPEDLWKAFGPLIAKETNANFGATDGDQHVIATGGGRDVVLYIRKKL
jgi:isoleucyl-tRNA synthetase/bisphosphoglycerate-dependent phosphoglycerate mutase